MHVQERVKEEEQEKEAKERSIIFLEGFPENDPLKLGLHKAPRR